MVKEFINGPMVGNMKVITRTIRSMVTVSTLTQTDDLTRVIGPWANSTVKASSSRPKESNVVASGTRASVFSGFKMRRSSLNDIVGPL